MKNIFDRREEMLSGKGSDIIHKNEPNPPSNPTKVGY